MGDTLSTIVEKQKHAKSEFVNASPTATYTSVSSSASTCVSPTINIKKSIDSLNPNATPNTVHITVTPQHIINIPVNNVGMTDTMNNMMKQYNMKLNLNDGISASPSDYYADPSIDSPTMDTWKQQGRSWNFRI